MGSPAAEQTAAERRRASQITQHAGLGSGRTIWSLIHPDGFLGHGCHCHPPPPHIPVPAQESLSHLWSYGFKPGVGSWSLCLAASGHLLPTASSRTGPHRGVVLSPDSLQQFFTVQPWQSYSRLTLRGFHFLSLFGPLMVL